MSSKSRVLVDDHYGQPCIAKFHTNGSQATVFSYHPWWSKVKGLKPLQGLARQVIIGTLTDPSTGTIGQVFDTLQPCPRVAEFRLYLLQELRWARRLIDAAIRHLDPESRQPPEPQPQPKSAP